ncbi:hypothetical protein DSO57_1033524 [Entomophthora muscae]|uniref:Uncharacterized protein n=1 Tax=Entomophthora muscae TaxID=34485 RepID=A0ACC2UKQ2_9FUNG|nr:hypothetical protein DSO57_1033524 [Entomophthora muscae]
MSKLTKNMDDWFFPLIVQVQELSTQITGVCATAAVKKILIYNALQVLIASRDSGVQQATTLNTLKESLHQLWTMQPPIESEAEFISEVHVLNSNSQDSFNEFANTGVDPNYKPSFKQVPYKLKKGHILTFLYTTCQEVVVPEKFKITNWAQIKEMLMDKFGGDLVLEIKKNAFMHIFLKPKKTLAEFTDCFYIKG